MQSAGGAIDCGSDCAETYDHGSSVVLTAVRHSATSVFVGWGGACASETGTTCTVSIDAAIDVTATFDLADRDLNVGVTGTGTGSVGSDPAGIDCGSDCTESYPHGTTVTLTATADGTTSVFGGWSGACSGTTPTCDVAMTSVRSVLARFDPAPRTVTVTVGGTGTGLVSSSPSGVDCPGDCTEAFPHDTSVTLTATPTGGSSFSGWGGACASEPSVICTFTADADVSVSADFD